MSTPLPIPPVPPGLPASLRIYLETLRDLVLRYLPTEELVDEKVAAGGGGGGASDFLTLTDTPASYVGQATKHVAVNAGETAVEFVAPPSAGVTDHGALTGLADDDHTQYLLSNGTRAMTADLDMGTNSIVSVGRVDGRDVSIDGTKLDGVENLADVTDSTNVKAALKSSPLTTNGDVLYRDATGALVSLGIGTAGQILKSTGSIPAWITPTVKWQRECWFTAFHLGDPGTGSFGDRSISKTTNDDDGIVAIDNWSDSNSEAGYYSMYTSDDMDTTVDMSAKFVFRLSGGPSSGDVVHFSFTGRVVADNESTASGGTLFGPTTAEKTLTGYSHGDLVVLDVATFITGGVYKVNRFIKGSIRRDGTHASDTYTGTVQWIGVVFIGDKLLF